MDRRDIIAIGGSLGSADAVTELCGSLPADLAAIILIVIHVGAQGNNFLAEIFNRHSALEITTAVDGEVPQHGHAYVAPADHHLLVIDGALRLGRGPRENMARPAIDPLFRSVGINFGPRAIGIVLTGMLNDGAAGLADVKRCGGLTIVQNPTDAVAPDMPLGALDASEVDYRASLAEMGNLLTTLVGQEAGPAPPVPPEVQLEVEIALGQRSDSAVIAKLATAVPLSCPACGGVLSQIKQWPPLRFRCQVGHAYTAETLTTEKETAVDEAVRVALRIVEERAVLTEKMAADARRSGRHAAAAANDTRAEECRSYADILRKAVAQRR